MLKFTIHACTLGVTLTSSVLVSANAATWDGSYVAEGQCFCVGAQGREIDSQIIPTPIGGQSVAQICDRIGDGPTLQKVNGKFNFPIYADAQCGHGPFPTDSASVDAQCSGHLGVAGEDCVAAGPEWDLKGAFAKAVVVEPGISTTSEATGISRHIMPPIVENASDASQSPSNTPVAKIVEVRSKSTPIVKAVPLTAAQIRARQLVQIEAARERARLQSNSDAESTIETPIEESIETVADAVDANSPPVLSNPTLSSANSALKLPVVTRNIASDFDYIEGMPTSYSFGGAGISVSASTSSHNRMQYLLKASMADTYQEAFIGVGFFLSPKSTNRLTVLLSTGIEYGKFEFRRGDVEADLAEAGAYLGLSSRFVINSMFELQAGVGYSSFFEGDAIAFGSAFYHLTPNLDITTKAEVGDNDTLGLGIRLYY